MTPAHRTRIRSELCPAQRELADNDRIVEGNARALEEYFLELGPGYATQFGGGEMTIESYVTRLTVNVQNGSIAGFDIKKPQHENPNFTQTVLEVTSVHEEGDDGQTITCKVHSPGREMSERAAVNFWASVEAVENL